MADELGISLGATYYTLRPLSERGLVRVERFSALIHNQVCAYALSLLGIAEKSEIAARLLVHKREGFEALGLEIGEHGAILARDFGSDNAAPLNQVDC
ncbi:MarR family EPS-associated transcriptional regulator [Porphyrobacter sp. TH134]|nr:MarR family EPS-associated transcriptional regulator [Porphyrobacter sp. TH134]